MLIGGCLEDNFLLFESIIPPWDGEFTWCVLLHPGTYKKRTGKAFLDEMKQAASDYIFVTNIFLADGENFHVPYEWTEYRRSMRDVRPVDYDDVYQLRVLEKKVLESFMNGPKFLTYYFPETSSQDPHVALYKESSIHLDHRHSGWKSGKSKDRHILKEEERFVVGDDFQPEKSKSAYYRPETVMK
jgi:hypothetical protein